MPTLLLYLKGKNAHEEPLNFRGMTSHTMRQAHIDQTTKRVMELYEKDLMLGSWEIVILGSRSRSGDVQTNNLGKITDKGFVERMKMELYLKTS